MQMASFHLFMYNNPVKNILKIIISFALLGGIVYFGYKNEDALRARFTPVVDKLAILLGTDGAPCDEPIVYTLGTFDKRFNITESYFLEALKSVRYSFKEIISED